MAQQLLNIGTVPNTGTGDTLRTMGTKVNANFTELYNQNEAASTPLLLGEENWSTLTHAGTSQNYVATGDIGFLPDSATLIIQASTSVSDGDVVGYGFYPELLKGSYSGETLSGTLTVGATEYSFSLTVDKSPDSDTSAFTAVIDTLISSTVASNAFTPVGYNAHAALYVSSTTSSQVEVRIAGGSWVDITALVDLEDAVDEDVFVNVGDSIEVRHTASASYSVTTSTVLAMGDPAVTYQFDSTTAVQGILTPSITSPLNEAIEASATLTVTSSAYSANGHAESHLASDWQVSEYADFSVIHEESLADAVNLVSWAPSTLATGTTYYVRVRYYSTTYTSGWASEVQFTTAATKVIRPDCSTPAQSATGVSTSPTLTSSAFAYSGPSQTHSQSQWQVTVAANDWNSSPVDDTSAVDLVSHAVSGLASSTIYKWRVRYQGSTTGWSEWSQPLIFETA